MKPLECSNEGNGNEQARKWDQLAKLLLVVGCMVVFSAAVNFEFVEWDDDVNILDNPHVGALGWSEIRWMFTDVERATRYLPLGWFCYAVERTVWGADPLIFHLGNMLIHIVNSLLLYGILKRALNLATGNPAGAPVRMVAAAALGSLFWALNPLRVEVVAWCSARIYLMATFWFFLSLWCYLQAPSRPAPAHWRWGAWGCFALSLLTYPAALMGGFIFPIIDWMILGRLPRSPRTWWMPEYRKIWLEKVPPLLLSMIWLFLMVATVNVGSKYSHLDTFAIFTVPQRIMQGLFGWVYYLWKPWFPTDLAPKYGNLIGFDPLEFRFVLSALVVAGVTAGALAVFRRWPVVLSSWIAHLILFLPFIGLAAYPHSLYDRYTYATGMVWSFLIGAVVWKAWPLVMARRAIVVGAGALLLCFATLSSRQTLLWQNTATVRLRAAEMVGEHPDRSEYEMIAGRYWSARQEWGEALACFRLAVEHAPTNHEARIDLGNALAALGRDQEALLEFRAILEQEPDDLATRLNLGVALCKIGYLEDGLTIFQGILRENPSHAGAQKNLQLALQQLESSRQNHPIHNRPSPGPEL